LEAKKGNSGLEMGEHFLSPYVQITFDTRDSLIAGRDPAKFLAQVLKYVEHVQCTDASPELFSVQDKVTGISFSMVAIGKGLNAESIARSILLLKDLDWDGVFSIESEGEQTVSDSIGWLHRQIAGSSC